MSLEPLHCPKLDVIRRVFDLVDAGAKFFSDLFESAPNAMVVIDSAGRVLVANAAACLLFAVDRTELVRLRVHDLLPRDLDLGDAARQLRDFGEASLEFGETTKGGTRLEMRLDARRSQPGRFLICFRDITREKRLERELERADDERAFGEAAAAVVHDLNNLLVPIVGNADLLSLRNPGDEELHGSVGEIRDAAIRATSLARRLLSVAGPTAEKPATVNLNTVVERLSDLLARVLGSRIELSMRLDPAIVEVSIDGERLERVVLNLVLNARDAMPTGGRLVIETGTATRERRGKVGQPSRRYATLSVTDTGVGMDRATRERIFEPFFSTKSRESGSGLGLSSALSFVRRNQGFIDVDSEPERGTSFRIGLPEIVDDHDPVLEDAHSDQL